MRDADTEFNYFFATQYADSYDCTITLVTPMWSAMHTLMVKLIGRYYEEQFACESGEELYFLDIGSGTGREALGVLSRLPDSCVVALDISDDMKKIFRRNFSAIFGTSQRLQDRVTFMKGNVVGKEGELEKLLEQLPSSERNKGYAGVFTAGTFHHFSEEERRKLLGTISSLLRPSGLFMNGDLFTFRSEFMAEAALDEELHWITESFERPPLGSLASAVPRGLRSGLCQKWHEHYRHENRPVPLEDEIHLLRELKFVDVEVPFRYGQLALVVAKSPPDEAMRLR